MRICGGMKRIGRNDGDARVGRCDVVRVWGLGDVVRSGVSVGGTGLRAHGCSRVGLLAMWLRICGRLVGRRVLALLVLWIAVGVLLGPT